jgi:ABC-type Fe3+/spermidine/putrescine transport system ATPase subunit
MLLEVEHVFKSYPGLPVLHDVSLSAEEGEIVCLLGPSGCGKSTLLRIIAGLEAADAGQVHFAGQDLAGVPPHRRRFGLMFQDYALFPHKDVAQNVAFGLRMARLPSVEIAARVKEMLALVGLSGYERRRVTELSGGEQQRVALARSLAPRPRLQMLDEPLGALDRALREQLMNELRTILKRVHVTALYVTHDQEEAFALADRVVILRARLEAGQGGHVEQVGTPQEVYRQPVSAYVARFLGFRNLLDGEVIGPAGGETPDDPRPGGRPFLTVRTALGTIIAADASRNYAAGDQITVLIRPEAVELLPASTSGATLLPGRLVERSFRGSYYRIRTEHAGGLALTFEMPAANGISGEAGDAVALRLDPEAVRLLPR